MLSTQDPVPGLKSSDFYVLNDPETLSTTRLHQLVSREWDTLPRVQYAIRFGNGEFKTAAIGDLVLKILDHRLFLEERTNEWVFMGADTILYGEDALTVALNLARTWVRTVCYRLELKEGQAETKKHYSKVMDILESPGASADVRQYIRAEVIVRANRATYTYDPNDLPVIIAGIPGERAIMLGNLNLVSGKVSPFTEFGRFPWISGLTLPMDWSPVAEDLVQKSKYYAHIKALTKESHRLADYLLSVMGYCCTNGNPMELIFFLWGAGGCGKSVMLYILKKVLGKLAFEGDYKAYTKGQNQNKFARSLFVGPRLVYFPEIPEGWSADWEKLKGDAGKFMNTEAKNVQQKESRVTHKLFGMGNFEIKVDDPTNASMGRVAIVETTGKDWRASKGHHNDYEEVLWREERDVIISALVYGMRRLHGKSRIETPDEYKASMDKTTVRMTARIEDYIACRLVLKPGAVITGKALSLDYRRFYDIPEGQYCRDTDKLGEIVKRLLGGRNAMNNKEKGWGRGSSGVKYYGYTWADGAPLGAFRGEEVEESLDLEIDSVNEKGIGL